MGVSRGFPVGSVRFTPPNPLATPSQPPRNTLATPSEPWTNSDQNKTEGRAKKTIYPSNCTCKKINLTWNPENYKDTSIQKKVHWKVVGWKPDNFEDLSAIKYVSPTK